MLMRYLGGGIGHKDLRGVVELDDLLKRLLAKTFKNGRQGLDEHTAQLTQADSSEVQLEGIPDVGEDSEDDDAVWENSEEEDSVDGHSDSDSDSSEASDSDNEYPNGDDDE